MKLKIAIISFIIEILVIISVFINNDFLLEIQIPLLIFFGYLSSSFGASFYFDWFNKKAIRNNQQDIYPYKLFIKLTPFINIFIFGFLGFLCLVFILLLVIATHY